MQFLIKLICLNLSVLAFAASPQLEDIRHLQTMLNSERIEYFFGSYGVEILSQAASDCSETRISKLYSLHDGQKITRTLAIVRYASPVSPSLETVHNNILAGASIGAAFKNAGWQLIKEPVFFGEIPLEETLRKWMQVESAQNASLQIYDLKVANATTPKIFYCRIIEIHSPLYLHTNLLSALYPETFSVYREADAQLLESIQEILKSLPN